MKNKKNTSGYLFNMILPLIFFEWWYVLLAFVFVVILETLIIKRIIKGHFQSLFFILLKANLISTVFGYLIQGILRISLGAVLSLNLNYNMPILDGILGNIGIDKVFQYSIESIIAVLTSIIVTFIISVIIERKIMIRQTKGIYDYKLVNKSIWIANIISYVLLTIWIFYNLFKIKI